MMRTANYGVAHYNVIFSLSWKGNPLALPKTSFMNEAILDRKLSKAIDKSNEQKVASKLIQDGGRLGLNDVMQKGKELNRENKRAIVKKKLGRVEEKLNQLKEKAAEMES